MMRDSAIKFADQVLTHHAKVAGEAEAYKALRARYELMVRHHEEESALLASTWDGVREAIRGRRVEDVFAGLESGCAKAKTMHDRATSFVDDALTHLAKVAGEEEVNKVLRARYEPTIRGWISTTPSVKESIERAVEFQRGHFGKTSMREESDRFVVTCDPCGSGGQLRRTKAGARTEKAHDWTWNKPDVPIYCTHCAIMWEILPMEIRGVPIRINLPPEKDSDPCVHLYYKSAEAIPEEYFKRVSRPRRLKMGSR